MKAQATNAALSAPLFESVVRIRTIFDAMQVLRQACTEYDFRYFSVISLQNTPADTPQTIAQLSLISSWPPEMTAEYDKLELARNSPILNELRKKITPVLIDIKALNRGLSTQKQLRADRLFTQYGLTMGVSFPIHDIGGLRYAVCFLGGRALLSDQELSALAMFATMLVEQISKINIADQPAKPILNRREVEILCWTAEGKTSPEIARITGLSEHTINRYATIATRKLGCSNRTQAVVCAIRLGLFS
ncbi:autoinducer binding domain-containing protein [Hoeflea sp. YIM 152468]|uniref:helix-turn-helix transcriptional regulator n=1 Tax=Hoeflea sp. YIM 152468 TaxID=3031759 RepID=UPI0023DAA8BE|nr:LuxR family transcriptional regulator [Hoeflea sp. YIM 152468]MDF1609632.1 autoinducer binding domain-containing protein [Hoeflea sp. YIM 152468]